MDQTSELNVVTEKIIGCAFNMVNSLDSGFLEKVYENALAHELQINSCFVYCVHPIHADLP